MADETLLAGGTETQTVDPVVQTLSELEEHVKALPAEQQAEFQKLDPAGRVAALSTAKQTREIAAYTEKLPTDQKEAFNKLDAAGKTAAIASAKQTAAYTEKLTPEQKAEFDKLKPEERTAKIAEAAKVDAVPDKYDFKYPEGFKIEEEAAKQLDTTFKELGLTQAKASKLMEMYVANVQKMQAMGQQQLAAQQKAWRDDFTKDPAHKQLLVSAKRGLSLADKETQAFIQNSWLGDHPGVLRLLAKVGELVKEDTVVTGKGGDGNNATGKTAAQIIYPGLPSKGV